MIYQRISALVSLPPVLFLIPKYCVKYAESVRRADESEGRETERGEVVSMGGAAHRCVSHGKAHFLSAFVEEIFVCMGSIAKGFLFLLLTYSPRAHS